MLLATVFFFRRLQAIGRTRIESMAPKRISTFAELEAIRLCPRAMVFLWVDWAIQARKSVVAFEGLLARWKVEHPELSVESFVVDVSGQEGETWEAVRQWLAEQHQPVDELTFSGCGAVLWLLAGTIVGHTLYAGQNPDVLLARTKASFQPPGAEIASSHKLRAIAEQHSPPQEWYESDEENLFD
jgi:hypothetical protein